VVAAASQCIKAILATSTGNSVLQKLETFGDCVEWSSYLMPFKPSKRRKVCTQKYVHRCLHREAAFVDS